MTTPQKTRSPRPLNTDYLRLMSCKMIDVLQRRPSGLARAELTRATFGYDATKRTVDYVIQNVRHNFSGSEYRLIYLPPSEGGVYLWTADRKLVDRWERRFGTDVGTRLKTEELAFFGLTNSDIAKLLKKLAT